MTFAWVEMLLMRDGDGLVGDGQIVVQNEGKRNGQNEKEHFEVRGTPKNL